MQQQKHKASVLVVTLMILGIVLVTALSIASVSIKEQKASLGSNKSTQAYQTAETGVELAMKDIIKGGKATTNLLTDCKPNGRIESSNYTVELLKSDKSKINCNTPTSVSEIAFIKSVGTVPGQAQRAIEAAVGSGCGSPITVNEGGTNNVYTPILAKDGKCWLDKNLGATQVATAFNDAAAYGWLFQWGRDADGHQIRTSATTTTLSSSSTPGNDKFITNSVSPYNWSSSLDNNLWQGVSGTNNPCPKDAGFRLPTHSEWSALVTAEGITDYNTAFSSSLKLTAAGMRLYNSAAISNLGDAGTYWSSTVTGANVFDLTFLSWTVIPDDVISGRANGLPIRCIKDSNPCPSPWGGPAIADGASVTAYQSGGTLPTCNNCISQIRVCNNGVLSGSYANQSCSVTPCDSGYSCFGGSTCSACAGGCCFGDCINPGSCTGNGFRCVGPDASDVCRVTYDESCSLPVDCSSDCVTPGPLGTLCAATPSPHFDYCVCDTNRTGCVGTNVCKRTCI